MRTHFRAFRTTLAIGIAATSLAACGNSDGDSGTSELAGNWSEIQAAAVEEGSVTLYGNKPDSLGNELASAFEAEYPGVELNYVQGTSAEQEIQVDQEAAAGAGGADAFLATDPIYFNQRGSEGAFATPKGPMSEDADWAEQIDDTGYVNISIDPYLFCHNTDLVESSPTTISEVLADQSFGSRDIGTSDIMALGTIAAYKAYEAQLGSDFLERLAATDPRIYAGFSVVAQALPAGEIKVALALTPPYYEAFLDANAPVECVVPTDAPVGVGYQVASLEAAHHPNAAQLLVDFMMSDEGQTILNGTLGFSPVDQSEGQIVPFSYEGLDDASNVEAFEQRFNELFK